MDIRSLQNSPIKKNDTDKILRGVRPEIGSSQAPEKASVGTTDKVSIGNVTFSNEVEFARSVLQNLREQAFENLRQIRSNIEGGVYNSDKIGTEIAKLAVSDVISIESLLSSDVQNNENLELTDGLKNRLLKDQEVLEKISSRLLDDIMNL